MVIKATSEVIGQQVLAWFRQVEAQRAQRAMLMDIQESRDLNMMSHVNCNNSKHRKCTISTEEYEKYTEMQVFLKCMQT